MATAPKLAEQIHAVHGWALGWYYPATAAVSGMGAGLVTSGGELTTAVSGGAAAAGQGRGRTTAYGRRQMCAAGQGPSH